MGVRLQGKVAVITGAAGSIGAEMARLFALERASVVIADSRADAAAALTQEIESAGGRAVAVAADITISDQVDRIFEMAEDKFGGVDILVNNAIDLKGDTTITKLEEGAFDRTIAVCLKGAFLCTRRALPIMEARGGGSIVTLSSVNALFGFGHTAYTAAKGALVSMMRLVAAEYGHLNIRSNVICPGTIETETSMRTWNSNPRGFVKLKEMYPLGRLGTPNDVAQYALFLASDESSFVTGSTQIVDGGLMAGRNFDF